MRVLIALILLAGAAFAASPIACEASSSIRPILNRLVIPINPRQPAADRAAHTIDILRKAITSAPRDVFLHEAYQDLVIGQIGDKRGDVIKEYEDLLARHSNDPVFLYLAARAEYGWKTDQAVVRLNQVITASPEFAPAYLLMARIDSASAFDNPKETAAYLDRFSTLCPSSIRVFPELLWSKDQKLIARTVARVRNAIAGRTDAEAETLYPLLWRLEAAMERSDSQASNRERVRKDAEALLDRRFARNTAWLSAIEFAADELEKPEWLTKARGELASLFPGSTAGLSLAWSEHGNSTQAVLALAREWSGSLALASATLHFVAMDRSANSRQIGEAVDLLKIALKNDPEAVLTSPPVPIEAAAALAERRERLADIPDLVRLGFTLTERTYEADSKSDLFANAASSAQHFRDNWYLLGYFPLLEAQIRLGRLPEAKDTLVQTEDLLNQTRPSKDAASEDRSRHAELEAWFWYLKGVYASDQEHKLDALVAYRNSIVTYPPRRPRPDRRDEVMQAAQQLWGEMGGTSQGWSDWAARSPLAGFYAGSGGPNAWSQLAKAKPGLLLTDSLGNKWHPEELAKKTTFVVLWASWCLYCRAELPYVEKLALRFKGRPDIAILALNVDDSPTSMETALKELRVTVPSIAARDFAYDLVPSMALPAAWLMTPSKTMRFGSDLSELNKWLEDAIQAVERAAAN